MYRYSLMKYLTREETGLKIIKLLNAKIEIRLPKRGVVRQRANGRSVITIANYPSDFNGPLSQISRQYLIEQPTCV